MEEDDLMNDDHNMENDIWKTENTDLSMEIRANYRKETHGSHRGTGRGGHDLLFLDKESSIRISRPRDRAKLKSDACSPTPVRPISQR